MVALPGAGSIRSVHRGPIRGVAAQFTGLRCSFDGGRSVPTAVPASGWDHRLSQLSEVCAAEFEGIDTLI